MTLTTERAGTTGRATGKPYRQPRQKLGIGTWIALAVAAVIVVLALVGPYIGPYDPTAIVGRPSQPPSAQFWAGTDQTGMDVFSRTMAGTRIDVIIALVSTLVATTVGIALGLLIGMNEAGRSLIGFLARGCSRFLDLMEAVPVVIISLVIVSFFGINTVTMIVALSIILVPIQARLVRTEVLRVRSEAYLDAARQAGLNEVEIILRHVLPNSTRPALQNTSVVFGITIVLTAALGFLGVGLAPPTPEWGSMITRGAGDAAVGKLWAAGLPSVALCITVATVSVLARRFGIRR